jgi:hypothetical protein
MLHTYYARIFINGGCHPVTVEARNTFEARMLLEAEYGRGCVVATPVRR